MEIYTFVKLRKSMKSNPVINHVVFGPFNGEALVYSIGALTLVQHNYFKPFLQELLER